ncbi:hypothetical protein SELMODRAFT_187743 [Selaginella moellendorffii]|uniref:MPN domain-containing protein n=1 Tax=Selaginella moellendorffii TaxID=88036 RepID=D8TEQ7_SELML|nr:NPL4-like protein 1 [Selaginella moellendorffii]EFJ04855.1 hypothetical protein SELMODRAFT_187743 [Selaginella moellendorffii]|eukprot:XP_002994068.1 NPL4-like protein 1 [Selaginella moellendorffii]
MAAAVVRIRSRDGLERVSVHPKATVLELQMAIERELQVPVSAQYVSRNQSLLMAKDPSGAALMAADMRDPSAALSSLGIGHGSVVFLFYSGKREVAGPKVTPSGAFGKKMTMDDLIARQTRVERQQHAHCNSLSFDRAAANAFQHYVHETLAFGVKRGGFMYGSVTEQGDALVHFIYEPPQQGSEDGLLLLRDPDEERRADGIAAGLGMRRLGFIFTHTISQGKADYTLSNAEIRQAAQLHAESNFDAWTTALVKLEANGDVQFESFQLSDQCIKLWKEGWFVQDAEDVNPKLSRMNKEVVILGKDTRDVDNVLFLVPVKILDHQGPLSCNFPIENRLTLPSFESLRSHLDSNKSRPYVQRISDFHLLLFLSKSLDIDTDIPRLTEAISTQGSVPDGYQLLIDSLASNHSY